MLRIRKNSERGHANHGWLDSYHSFSFASYYDPEHMHFRNLRVINEDVIEANAGFPTHPHEDMEIITYIIEGAIEHKDSMGNGSIIRQGEIQRMTAGTGITHSEYNHYADKPLHLLQIWILPNQKNLKPGYEQKNYIDRLQKNVLCLIASDQDNHDAIKIHQNVYIFTARTSKDNEIQYTLDNTRHAWIQLISGKLSINDITLEHGDALAISDETYINIRSITDSEFLLFDLN